MSLAKLHVLLKKEEIDQQKIEGKIVVVFDVLLATSTIVSALHFGAKAVFPVLNEHHARKLVLDKQLEDSILVGESEGKMINGFLDPNPVILQKQVKDRTMILSTTNGTVAIHGCQQAKKVYVSSLLNNQAIAKQLLDYHDNESIIIVCSGSSGQFCIEDMLGAGSLLHLLLTSSKADLDLSDAALAALYLYRNSKKQMNEMLYQSRVGKMLFEEGYEEALDFVMQESVIPIVTSLTTERCIVVETNLNKQGKC